MQETYVALLRGINVGGKNKLPMKALAAIFSEAGCSDVQTYIQSGNVVFRCTAEVFSGLRAVIEAAIESQFGFRPPVVLRSRIEIERAVSNNPYVADGKDENTLHVLFLADLPTPEAVASLDPERGLLDRYTVIEREIYVHIPGSVADTKLTNAYFDSRLKTICTGRNWRTTLKLLELTNP